MKSSQTSIQFLALFLIQMFCLNQRVECFAISRVEEPHSYHYLSNLLNFNFHGNPSWNDGIDDRYQDMMENNSDDDDDDGTMDYDGMDGVGDQSYDDGNGNLNKIVKRVPASARMRMLSKSFNKRNSPWHFKNEIDSLKFKPTISK